MNKPWIHSVWVAMLVSTAILPLEVFAQFNFSAKKSDSDSNAPTIIHSDSMDMDLAHDKIILLGNVDVQTTDMGIKCRKMIIYLGKSQKKSKVSAPGGSGNGKDVIQIDCIGDVVITKKTQDVTKNQQAFAGKAVYLVQNESITLTESPIVVDGGNRLEGEQIIMFTETDRIMVLKPVTTLRNEQK